MVEAQIEDKNLTAARSLLTYLTLLKQASSEERIPEADLRWTEQMVYQLYKYDQETQMVKMSHDANLAISAAEST